MDLRDLSSAFQEAAAAVLNSPNIETSSMLRLYGLYKQANNGPCNIPKPGIFSFTAREKWQAWNCLGTMNQSDAMSNYIDIVRSLDIPTKGLVLGVSRVSCMARSERQLRDEDKTVFDWLKESNAERVSSMLQSDPGLISRADESGMFLIHWAADRGDTNMIELLLDGGGDIDVVDGEGQTALHFASACGHHECICLLKRRGANESIVDQDGNLAIELIVS